MATYYGTYGQKVQYLASDPSDPQIGQVWYNSTSAILKVRQEVTVNAWATGGNLNAARGVNMSGGSQTSAITFGGGYPTVGTAESYNGSSWTTVPSLNRANAFGSGCGTQTAALQAGGQNSGGGSNTFTELWNGTSWTNNPSGLGTSRYGMVGVGIQTAALVCGGWIGSVSDLVESFNGTSFTAGTAMNNGRYGNTGFGTSTAALVVAGRSPASTELWNGTSWTNSPANLNTARNSLSGAGVQTLGLAFGGGPLGAGGITSTELWNGSTWTANPTGLGTGRYGQTSGAVGDYNAAMIAGGWTTASSGANTAATEEWTGQAVQVRTITTS
jgi:hypothetical protein